MFATFAGGYSELPLPAQPDLLGQAERDLAGVDSTPPGTGPCRRFVREIPGRDGRHRIGIVGDGRRTVAGSGAAWIHGLAGLELGGDATLPDGEPVLDPVATGGHPLGWPVTVPDSNSRDAETALPVKQTVIGPWTLAGLAEPGAPAGRRAEARSGVRGGAEAEILAARGTGCRLEVDEAMALPDRR